MTYKRAHYHLCISLEFILQVPMPATRRVPTTERSTMSIWQIKGGQLRPCFSLARCLHIIAGVGWRIEQGLIQGDLLSSLLCVGDRWSLVLMIFGAYISKFDIFLNYILMGHLSFYLCKMHSDSISVTLIICNI